MSHKKFLPLLAHTCTLFGVLMVCLSILQWTTPSNLKKIKRPYSAGEQKERYNHDLAHIKSMDDLTQIQKQTFAGQLRTSLDTARYVDKLDSCLKDMFWHGYSYYGMGDNYIAYLLGQWVWRDFAAVVIPDDILKASHGSCSQQNLVFLHFLHRQGFRVRVVALKLAGIGHYAPAVWYANQWRYYDVNLEAIRSQPLAQPVDSVMTIDKKFAKKYPHLVNGHNPNFLLQPPYVSEYRMLPEGSFGGNKMAFFHRVTWFLSQVGGILLLMLAFVLYRFAKQPVSGPILPRQ